MPKADFGAGAVGAASGAATGSAFGLPGAVIGGIGGGLLGLFGRKKKKAKKLSTLDEKQQKLYDEYNKGVMGQGGQFQDMFNFDSDKVKDVFDKMYAKPAYQKFNEEVVPGITGSFRGGNIQNSSYLGGALSKAGTNVQTNLDTQLASMLYQGQQNSLNRRMKGINDIMNTQTFAYQQPQESAGDKAFGALAKTGGKVLANYASSKFKD